MNVKCMATFWDFINVCLWLIFVTVTGAVQKRQTSPVFLAGPGNVTVHKGGLAELKCRIRDLGPKQVAWRKLSMDYPLTIGTTTFDQDEDISVDHREYTNSKVSEWNLIIKRAQPRHSGTYECQITATQILTHYVHLYVLDAEPTPGPKSAISLNGTEYVNLYDPIRLTCNATFGQGAHRHIDWFHNGQMIKPSDKKWRERLQITHYTPVHGHSLVSELFIDYSLLTDDGRYVCRTMNYVLDKMETESMDVNVLNTYKDLKKRKTVGSISDPKQGNSGGSNSVTSWYAHIILCILVIGR